MLVGALNDFASFFDQLRPRFSITTMLCSASASDCEGAESIDCPDPNTICITRSLASRFVAEIVRV
jgi:hypothetical protein